MAAGDSRSIDDHFIADLGHAEEPLQICISETYASMRNALPEKVRGLGTMNGVAVAEIEPVKSKLLVVLALRNSYGRDDDRFPRHDDLAGRQFAHRSVLDDHHGLALDLHDPAAS